MMWVRGRQSVDLQSFCTPIVIPSTASQYRPFDQLVEGLPGAMFIVWQTFKRGTAKFTARFVSTAPLNSQLLTKQKQNFSWR